MKTKQRSQCHLMQGSRGSLGKSPEVEPESKYPFCANCPASDKCNHIDCYVIKKYGHLSHRCDGQYLVALVRDSLRCQECGSEQELEVHHKDVDEYNNALKNLVTLCKPCHLGVHKELRLEASAKNKIKSLLLEAHR